MISNKNDCQNMNVKNIIDAISIEFEKDENKKYLKSFVEKYIAIGDSLVYGGKHCGSDAEHIGADLIYNELKTLGLKAEKIPFNTTRFQFNDSEIIFKGQNDIIKPYGCMTVSTPKEGITGKLLDVGEGHKSFYETNEVKDKIVLIETKEDFEDGTIAGVFQMCEAAKHGAAAIILYTKDYTLNDKTIRATYSAFGPYIPYVTISAEDAEILKYNIKNDSNFEITLKVDSDFSPNKGTSYEIIGEIEGKTDERIIYSAHIDHFFRGVQDNVTAVASLLAIAKILKKIEYVPERTITFVFSGSHELGMVDTAAPDLLGPWKLLTELKPNWIGNTIAVINFEYTALCSKTLRANTTYEVSGMYEEFCSYMPDYIETLGNVQNKVPSENYYLFTWCDACTFIMKGIPVFMNDAVSEQIYEAISPYMGRDHSNMDNMDVYSDMAHINTTLWYACLGVFLDNKAVLELNYRGRINSFELNENEKKCLDRLKVDYVDFEQDIEQFKVLSKVANDNLKVFNSKGIISEKSIFVNKKLLEIQQHIADGFDGLSTEIPSTISVPHKVYIKKAEIFEEAKEIIAAEGYDSAYNKCLKKLDLVGIEEKYCGLDASIFKELVLGKNAFWNKDKCYNFFITDDVTEDKLDATANENIKILRDVIKNESEKLATVNELLIEVIITTTESADMEQMLKWIEGFTVLPHRKTGTEEGLKSAKYVEKTFSEIGLDEVKTEKVKSVIFDCPTYSLSVDGENIECFFVNGANRKAEVGDFKSEIIDAEMVYLGKGELSDFELIDVKGKIVVCDVYFKPFSTSDLMGWAEDTEIYDPLEKSKKKITKYDIYTPNNWPYNYIYAREKGAAGFVGILHNFMDCNYYHEDYIDIVDIDGYMDMPALWISKNDGKQLSARLKKENLRANMKIHTIYKEGEARIVSGILKGNSEDIVIVHSHHDAVNNGAVQDASGMSEVFALATFFKNIPKEIRNKTLMFVATDSHYTDYEGHVGFLENRKNAGDRIVIDFAIEHIAQEMHLDDDNNIVLTGEPETRILYVDDKNGLYQLAKSAVKKYNVEKTVMIPVKRRSSGAFTNDDVCSDAYDFNASGIPVVSMLSAPMYLFHNSDTIDKVHKASLEQIRDMYAYMILKVLQD